MNDISLGTSYVCGLLKDEKFLLQCAGITHIGSDGQMRRCNILCHSYCLIPPLDSVPDNQWYFLDCLDAMSRQGRYEGIKPKH